MANMSLGGQVFEINPTSLSDSVDPERYSASVQTYSSVAFFSWGLTLVGKKIDLTWEFMPNTQYEALLALYAGDTAVAFAPQDGKVYQVEMTSLHGTFNVLLEGTGTWAWRKAVTLSLLFLDEGV